MPRAMNTRKNSTRSITTVVFATAEDLKKMKEKEKREEDLMKSKKREEEKLKKQQEKERLNREKREKEEELKRQKWEQQKKKILADVAKISNEKMYTVLNDHGNCVGFFKQ